MLSFIVPAYNEEHELPGALDAIRAAAEASGQSFEIVVVDDASSDATPEIAKAAGAAVVPVCLRHIAAVRNAGAHAARGETFFFVDADTAISSAHVTGALSALAAGCAGGGAPVLTEGSEPWWGPWFVRFFSFFYFRMANLGAGAFLFTTRDNFQAVGGFDEQYYAGEEVYFTMALKKLGRFQLLREPIVTSGRNCACTPRLTSWRNRSCSWSAENELFVLATSWIFGTMGSVKRKRATRFPGSLADRWVR